MNPRWDLAPSAPEEEDEVGRWERRPLGGELEPQFSPALRRASCPRGSPLDWICGGQSWGGSSAADESEAEEYRLGGNASLEAVQPEL